MLCFHLDSFLDIQKYHTDKFGCRFYEDFQSKEKFGSEINVLKFENQMILDMVYTEMSNIYPGFINQAVYDDVSMLIE